MRVDAMTIPGAQWFLWDCELCLVPRDVLWIDDELNQYEQALRPLHLIKDRVATRLVTVRKIVINVERLVILINPHALDEDLSNYIEATRELERA